MCERNIASFVDKAVCCRRPQAVITLFEHSAADTNTDRLEVVKAIQDSNGLRANVAPQVQKTEWLGPNSPWYKSSPLTS